MIAILKIDRIKKDLIDDGLLKEFVETNSQFFIYNEYTRLIIAIFDRIGLEDFADDMENLKKKRIEKKVRKDLEKYKDKEYFIYIGGVV